MTSPSPASVEPIKRRHPLSRLASRVIELEIEVKDLRTTTVLLQQASLAAEARATALLEAHKEIAREQSAVNATTAADRFQSIARAAINAGASNDRK